MIPNTTSAMRCLCVFMLSLALGVPPTAAAIDLLPDFLKKTPLTSTVWREQEQFVGLAPQSSDDAAAAPNEHPSHLEGDEIRDALKSLQLWQSAGLVREEQSSPLLTATQAEVLGRYLADALGRAKPNEDVLFTVRGYGAVAFDAMKEREWTSGRAFVAGGRLNVILGAYQIRKDRGKRNAEASYGVIDDYSDLNFNTGSRAHKSASVPGRIVATAGLSFPGGENGGRPDWLQLEVHKAAVAYRDALVPEEDKKREKKAQQDAAQLTLERRQMREEMARMRQEIKSLKAGGTAGGQSVEERLQVLGELQRKKLITDEEFRKRRAEILGEL